MKESWLEKLIELFRDYVENYWNDTKDPTIDNVVIYDWQWFYFGARFYSDEKVLSKKFWFIKRLVENDKIDKRKVLDGEKRTCWELVEKDIDDFPYKVQLKERLLMLLSISDTPIEDLISYLK